MQALPKASGMTSHIALALYCKVLGRAVLAALYPLARPFYTAGIMLFDISVLVFAICLHVVVSQENRFRISARQADASGGGVFRCAEAVRGTVPIAGIGVVWCGDRRNEVQRSVLSWLPRRVAAHDVRIHYDYPDKPYLAARSGS
jgi:hypothetical protein